MKLREIVARRLRQLLQENIQLEEGDINFHLGDIKDTENIKPHFSDNILVMQGRGTGHFGSGVYFSTYSCSYMDSDTTLDKFRGDDYPQKFTNVNGKGVYRVDLDIYKNLYRVKSEAHGDLLFKTLKFANTIFYKNIYYHSGEFDKQNDLSSDYLKLKHNLSQIGLRLPNYKDFIRMIINAGKNIVDKKYVASFSTRIMEYNGFNGVNVSNIPMYDNTRHGSVIYDMSKLSDKPIPINVNLFCKHGTDYDSKTDVIQTDKYNDYDVKLLQGEIPRNIENVPTDKLVMFLKRYVGFLDTYTLENLDYRLREIYYRKLRKNLINGLIETKPNYLQILPLIDDNRFEIIMDINCKINNRTILDIILNMSGLLSDGIEKIKNNINRELTPEEQESLDWIDS